MQGWDEPGVMPGQELLAGDTAFIYNWFAYMALPYPI